MFEREIRHRDTACRKPEPSGAEAGLGISCITLLAVVRPEDERIVEIAGRAGIEDCRSINGGA